MSQMQTAPSTSNPAIIRTEALCKYWGGLKALDDISLSFADKQLHSIVGPNGAGKSTLLNLLCGTYKPTSGRILHEGEAIDNIKPYAFARRGIGRSFQKTNIYPSATCLENCAVAAQRYMGGSFNFLRNRNQQRALLDVAREALNKVGLSTRENTLAANISYGEQRQLEIAMVLATSPCVLLLDEPMAGMGHEESALITDLLKQLKREYCIVLVEHDMDAVFELSDLITVMVNGQHLITGQVDAVREDPRVKEAYLGQGDEVF